MYIDAVVLLRVNSCMAIEHSGSVNNGLKQKHLTTSTHKVHRYIGHSPLGFSGQVREDLSP